MAQLDSVALYYDDDAYLEQRRAKASQRQARGLMGRQVAGRQFLEAYLAHGTWSVLNAIVSDARSGQSLYRFCASHPSSRSRRRRLRIFQLGEFLPAFAAAPPAAVLHFPCPPDVRFAWAREHLGAHRFALTGVTHTLCSAPAVAALRELITAPFEEYDRLICTSRAVVDMVRAVLDTYTQYLGERFGARPRNRVPLELIPLGVDVTKFRPPTSVERAAERQRLHIEDDELVVLFVGRLAHHAKAHPFPMYHALAEAARRTQRPVHLLLAGWAAASEVLDAFRDGAQQFAPGVRTTILDGNHPGVRAGVWRAADVFTSLSDNLQETFGLAVIEAMASGLPVIASDWNGYRDLVAAGETGFLVPTYMVSGAMQSFTAQLLLGEINYDHFLARCNQCVAVDAAATADAFERLLADADLRRRMGAAGRQRACERFSWEQVIRSYETLWSTQVRELATFRSRAARAASPLSGPSAYPAPDMSFASYPTRHLDDSDVLYSPLAAAQRVAELTTTPLTNYEPTQRCVDVERLQYVLESARKGQTLRELSCLIEQAGFARPQARATIAWLLKYDLLRPVME